MLLGMCRTGILVRKNIIDISKNPAMLLCIFMPVVFTLLYRILFGMDSSAQAAEGSDTTLALRSITLCMAMCMSIGMASTMPLVYGLAEDRESHAMRSVLLSGVSGSQMLIAKGLVAMGSVIGAAILCFAASGSPLGLFRWYLLFCAIGALPIIELSLSAGIASSDQMSAGLFSVPVLLLAIAPIFSSYSDQAQSIVLFLPTGGASSLLEAAIKGDLACADALPALLITIIWVAASALILKRALRRFPCAP